MIVEEFNASVRKLISAKLMMSRKDLDDLTAFRDTTVSAIVSDHTANTEAQIRPNQTLQNFIEFEKA